MDEITSTEFRKRYARLTEPTLVTVNGHYIGGWIPAISAQVRGKGLDVDQLAILAERPSAQAQRDELLRKINRR
jgi:hypothetical protein